jgi:hypothetical protein
MVLQEVLTYGERSRPTLAFSCGARSAFTVKERSYLRNMLSRRQLQGFVIPPLILEGFQLPRRNEEARRSSNHSTAKAPGRLRAARFTEHSSLALLYWFSNKGTRDNGGLQLRRAITIQAERKEIT